METLRIEQTGSLTTVHLARPGVRNAFNETLIRELTSVFRALPQKTRVVVLRGDGAAFCAGADLAWMQKSVGYSTEDNARDATELAGLFEAIDAAPACVIGRLHGAAVGGGVGLLACCDIVVAEAGAKLGFTEVRLGLVPAVISPFVVRKIGVSAARRYFLTGELFSAEEAMRIGLVHAVVEPTQLDDEVQKLVGTVLANGPIAVQEAKRLVRACEEMEGEALSRHTIELIARLRTSPEGQEGLGAFLAKRKPSFG